MTYRKDVDITNKQGEVLHAISISLMRESHVITKNPGLFWQQMHNRLQWEGDEIQEILIPELTQRSKSGAKPWIKMKTKPPESTTLQQRLDVGEKILQCVFSPDGSILICKCRSGFRVWDAITGSEEAETVGIQDLVQKSISYVSNWSNKSHDKKEPNLSPDKTSINPYGITCVNSTPKLFLNFMEGILKISYPGPGKLTFNFWELKSGKKLSKKKLWTTKYIDFGIEACAFSPDLKHAVTCIFGWNKTIIFWDFKKGRIISRINNRKYRITACDFSPDGQRLVTAGFDQVEGIWIIRVWEISSRECINTFRGHSGDSLDEIIWCHFSPDGLKVISGGNDHMVYKWDLIENSVDSDNLSHGGEVTGCKFSFDGNSYISSGGELLNVHSSLDGSLRSSWKIGNLSDPGFNQDGSRIIAIMNEKKLMNPYESEYTLRIFDSKNSNSLMRISGSEKIPISHTSFGKSESPTRHFLYKCVGFSPNDHSILTAGFGNYETNLIIWDGESGKPLRTLEGNCKSAESLRLSKDGNFLGVATFSNNTVDIWDVTTGKKIIIYKGHESIVYNLGFYPDNSKVVSCSSDGKVLIWEFPSGKEIITLIGHTSDVRFCGFSPQGENIFSGGSDYTFRVWNMDGDLIALLPTTYKIVNGDIHPFLPRIILGDEAGFVHLVELFGGS